MALGMNSFTESIMRQRVVAQIDAAREGLEVELNTSEEMENCLYEQAKSRDEYMQLIAALVLYLNNKKRDALRCKGSQEVTQRFSQFKGAEAAGAAVGGAPENVSEEKTEETEQTNGETKEEVTKEEETKKEETKEEETKEESSEGATNS